MRDGRISVLAEILLHPCDPFTTHDVVCVDHLLNAWNPGHMPAYDDDGTRGELSNAPAHLAHLPEVGNDAGNPNDVVRMRSQLLFKFVQGREVEHRAGCRNVLLNHHQSPRAVEHAQRKAVLRAGDLVVVQLHRIDGAAAEFIVLRVGAKSRREKNSSLNSLGVV